MTIRQFIAALLLLNYLLVVGAGCVNRPEDQHGLVLVQTIDDSQNYQECRYLRLDSLEAFLADALINRYQNADSTNQHHLFFVVAGVDAHYLPTLTWPLRAVTCRVFNPAVGYTPTVAVGVSRDLYTPPWFG